MLSVTKECTFDAAHSLPYYEGACHNLHGHRWTVRVTLAGNIDDTTGMIVDFVDLKKAMKEHIVDKYDHKHLNGVFDNPTAENMVIVMQNDLYSIFGLSLYRIRLYETPTSYAEWCK